MPATTVVDEVRNFAFNPDEALEQFVPMVLAEAKAHARGTMAIVAVSVAELRTVLSNREVVIAQMRSWSRDQRNNPPFLAFDYQGKYFLPIDPVDLGGLGQSPELAAELVLRLHSHSKTRHVCLFSGNCSGKSCCGEDSSGAFLRDVNCPSLYAAVIPPRYLGYVAPLVESCGAKVLLTVLTNNQYQATVADYSVRTTGEVISIVE